MTDKDFISHLSTATLRSLFAGLRDDKADLRAAEKLATNKSGYQYDLIVGSIGTIDELMADIGIEVNGNRGETL